MDDILMKLIDVNCKPVCNMLYCRTAVQRNRYGECWQLGEEDFHIWSRLVGQGGVPGRDLLVQVRTGAALRKSECTVSRQLLGVLLGAAWGLLPLKGFIGLLLFAGLNAGLVYVWFTAVQQVDEAEFGGAWELTKEGFLTSAAGFLVTWIIIYTGLHVDM